MSKTSTEGGERDRLTEHEYDGIHEYDNPLPGWWVWIFWGTIIFSGGYFAYYQLGPGPSVIAQYEEEMHEAAEHEAVRSAAVVQATDASILALKADRLAMEKAREIFVARCAPCHGPDGQGVIGPNLTDEYWLHGGRPTEILHTISEGVPDKGMVPWKGQLSPGELKSMAAYVLTLRGTHPPNPKAPQGVKIAAAEMPASR